MFEWENKINEGKHICSNEECKQRKFPEKKNLFVFNETTANKIIFMKIHDNVVMKIIFFLLI